MRSWCVVLSAAAACASEPSGPVRVTGDEISVTDAGIAYHLLDLTDLAAYRIDGAGLTPLRVDIDAEGAVVADAPDGLYYLEHRGRWWALSSRDADVSTIHLGRDGVVESPDPTSLTLSLAEAAPWRDGDRLQLYSAGAGLWRLAPASAADLGATDVTETIDFAAERLPRVEGDPAWVAQLSTRQFAGRDYLALERAAQLPAFDLAADPAAVVAATLAVPPAAELAIDWPIGDFDALRLATQPVIATSFYDLGVSALPGADVLGQYDDSADLAVLRITDATGDHLTGRLGFTNPFPGDWDPLVTAVAWYPDDHRAAAGDVPVVLFDAIWLRRLAAAAEAAPMAPRLSPPRDLRVDGAAAVDQAVLARDLPEIAWDAPALGEPDRYQVEVFALFSDGGVTSAQSTLVIETTARALRLPPAAFIDGAAGYVVRVAAVMVQELGTATDWASLQSGVLRR